MNILGFDTCLNQCSAGLGIDLGKPSARIFLRSEVMKTGHAERLIPMIQELLIEADCSVEHINKIAVTCGPGSFTGVRISIAAARALHLARQIPLVPFSSLEAIALNGSIRDACRGKDLVVAVDAHRDEAYVQRFDGTTLEPFGDPHIVAEKDYSFLAKNRPIYVVGTAASKVVQSFNKVSDPNFFYEGPLLPSLSDVILRSQSRSPTDKSLEPLYIREPDAKPQVNKIPLRI